ncbi:MAG: YbjN domain-containing protein [Saprospiraceae bacterium]
MSIWDRLFGNDAPAADAGPGVRFGRYSDAYKTAANYRAWDESLAAFDDERTLAAYEHFLRYLRDEDEHNVRFHRENDQLYFEFYQGSKRITGRASDKGLRLEARVAALPESASPNLLRRLMQRNYELRYSRFSLSPEREITIVFDSGLDDGTPHKLYHAFKEVALQADKQDDLLLEEFKQLRPLEASHLTELPEAEREVKITFLTQTIQGVLDQLSSGRPNPESQPGGVAYLLLDLVYKLDYLIRPEGYTMEALERMHRLYFANEPDKRVTYKNARLVSHLKELLDRAPADFRTEMYRGRSTFAITQPISHDRLAQLIGNELSHMDWYQDNDLATVALAIPGYIVGYTLFNYAPPPPDRDLFHLYLHIRENAYFRQLGYEQEFLDAEGRPHRRVIRAAIAEIAERHRRQYPRLRPSLSGLEWDTLTDFSRSFLKLVQGLDLEKI